MAPQCTYHADTARHRFCVLLVLVTSSLFPTLCAGLLLAVVLLAAATAAARPGQIVDPLEACLGQPAGAFVNNPADCQAFWICGNAGDTPIHGRCPNGYNFNQATTLCELPQDFPCSDDDDADEVEVTTVLPTTPSPPLTPSPPSPTPPPPPPPPTDETACQNRPNGYFVNNPVDCQAYWVCYNGSAHGAACRPGLNFNEAAQVCDNPENYPCANGDDEADPEFRCPAAGIHMYPMPDSCTRFRFCFAGHLAVRGCAVGLEFDERLRRCNFAELVECTRGQCPPVNDPQNVVTLASRVRCEA